MNILMVHIGHCLRKVLINKGMNMDTQKMKQWQRHQNFVKLKKKKLGQEDVQFMGPVTPEVQIVIHQLLDEQQKKLTNLHLDPK